MIQASHRQSPTLRRLLYVSQPTHAITSGELRQIVGVASISNRRAGITGVLAFTGDHFAQFIEGAPEAVERLGARIALDGRHGGFRVVRDLTSDGPRQFTAWEMQLVESPALGDVIGRLMAQDRLDHDLAEEAVRRMADEVRWQTVADIHAHKSTG